MLNTSKIEGIRKQNNFSQSEFAERLNISTNTYQNWVKNGDFRATAISKISKDFNVAIAYLFDENENYSVKDPINCVNEPNEGYGLKKENLLLKNRIKDLEKIIELLEKK
jgi:transcriptional regulator with XRE-family HTH domain